MRNLRQAPSIKTPFLTTNFCSFCFTLEVCAATPPFAVGLGSTPVGLGVRSTPRHCACSCPLTYHSTC